MLAQNFDYSAAFVARKLVPLEVTTCDTEDFTEFIAFELVG